MAEKPKSRIVVTEWTGLVSNRGPFVGKPGDAREQVNIRAIAPGVLAVRNGMRPVYFES
jgi:hypothetical protein